MEADVTESDGSPARWGRPRASSLAVLGFALALSSTTVIYPLLALDAGYSAVVIGVFTSISAGAQLVSRLGLPWLLARISDRAIVGGAAILMAGSAGALVLTTGVSAFILAQLLQGTARALFWTASQTHAVRTPGIALRRLAQVQVASHSGALVGPVVAGVIASRSLRLALGLTIAGALAAATTSMFMSRLEPYQRKARGGRASWRRSLGATGYWTSFAGGGWRGLLDSFVPVVLAQGGLGAGTIGWLISVADGAPLLTASALARWGGERLLPLARAGAVGMLAGVVTVSLVGGNAAVAAVALLVGGAGGGLATTLGSALASREVDESEQGTALAIAGAYRAAARMVTPSAVSAVGAVVGIPWAMGIAATGIASPILAKGWRRSSAPASAAPISEPKEPT